MANDSKIRELYVMMFTLQTLHNKGITVKETVSDSLKHLLRWYQQFGNRQYLKLASLHMQAYANMGFALDDRDPTVKELLDLLGRTKNDFFPKGQTIGKRVKVNKSQVRAMIGKWKPSEETPLTIGELVDEIIGKIKEHKEGRYIYQYHRKNAGGESEPEVYELVINKEESYFYDVKNFRFYTFIEE